MVNSIHVVVFNFVDSSIISEIKIFKLLFNSNEYIKNKTVK